VGKSCSTIGHFCSLGDDEVPAGGAWGTGSLRAPLEIVALREGVREHGRNSWKLLAFSRAQVVMLRAVAAEEFVCGRAYQAGAICDGMERLGFELRLYDCATGSAPCGSIYAVKAANESSLFQAPVRIEVSGECGGR